MNEFFCSARGESATTWLDKTKYKRSKLPWPAVKLAYPSHQTVMDSVSGFRVNALLSSVCHFKPRHWHKIQERNTLFCRTKQWEARSFPKELLYDSNSKRGRISMHSKVSHLMFLLSQSRLNRSARLSLELISQGLQAIHRRQKGKATQEILKSKILKPNFGLQIRRMSLL